MGAGLTLAWTVVNTQVGPIGLLANQHVASDYRREAVL